MATYQLFLAASWWFPEASKYDCMCWKKPARLAEYTHLPILVLPVTVKKTLKIAEVVLLQARQDNLPNAKPLKH